MGCIQSQKRNGRIFEVYNIDESGEELNSGKLEVTDSELVLHHKGKEVRWPLRALRRYGWEQELFSFESGRRCPTGPGIYAFKCKNAELLFSSVQECIHRAGQAEFSGNQPFDHNVPNSRPTSMIEMNDITVNDVAQNGMFVSTNSDTVNYVNQPSADSDPPQYVNTGARHQSFPDVTAALTAILQNPPVSQDQEPRENYAELEFSSSDENVCPDAADARLGNRGAVASGEQDVDEGFHGNEEVFEDELPQNDYINVGPERQPERPPPPWSVAKDLIREPDYTNVQPSVTVPPSALPPRGSLGASGTTRINYIMVVSNSDTTTSPVSPGFNPVPRETQPSNCYATIDIPKTKALEKGFQNLDNDDGGSRKTRHNSTFNDM